MGNFNIWNPWSRNGSGTSQSGYSRPETNESTYCADNPRRSQRAGEATQSATTLLKNVEEQLSRSHDENKRLDRSNTRLRGKLNKADRENKALEVQRKWLHDHYEFVLDKALRPYSKIRGGRFSNATNDTLLSLVEPMFYDAMHARTLRAKVQNLERHASNANIIRERTQKIQKDAAELKALREQVQALHNDAQETGRLRIQAQSMHQDAAEVEDLREQVLKLQQAALAKVEKVQAVPDNQFAQEFSAIAAMVRFLSRSVCLSNDPSILNILNAGILIGDVPLYRWGTRAEKKCFVEAWIWSTLIELIFFSPFAMFHDDGEAVSDAWSKLFDPEHTRRYPVPSPQCEAWRCSTMEYMVDMAGRAAIMSGIDQEAGQPPEVHTSQGLRKSVLLSRVKVVDYIRSCLSQLAPAANLSEVQNIVDKAFSLSMEMSLQRSRLQVTYPAVGVPFNKDQMSILPDRSGKDQEDGSVAFVVNPGLTKWGNAEGRNLDCRYDIVPCLVQIEPSVQTEAAVIKPQPPAKVDGPVYIKVEPHFIPPKPYYNKPEPKDVP